MPVVSVIVPNYNHAKYLRERIDSILNQSYGDFELIVLDDCSTDNSVDVIESYRGHAKISAIVINASNSGSTFLQWERGIALAKGKWIWIAESDDWCESNFLETLMAQVSEDSVISFAQSLVVTDDGQVLWNTRGDRFEERLRGEKFVKDKMLHGNSIINASMSLFRKDSFQQIAKEFTTYKFCGDWLFWIEIALLGEVCISGKVLNYFRKHPDDVSSGAFRSGLYYREYFKLIDTLQARAIIDGVSAEAMLHSSFSRFLKDNKLDIEARQSIKEEFKKRLRNGYFSQIAKYKIFKLKQRWSASL